METVLNSLTFCNCFFLQTPLEKSLSVTFLGCVCDIIYLFSTEALKDVLFAVLDAA
jgi:hypothetical protein